MGSALYITADAIGTATGGGSVTYHESRFLSRFFGSEIEIWQFPEAARPWGADDVAAQRLAERPEYKPDLAHFYAGSFTRTVQILKRRGTKIVYTAAAHDIGVSREEHEKLGLPFDYPHLTDPDQWDAYVRGYLLADVVICPSLYSQATMIGYGCEEVTVIPHGIAELPPLKLAPSRFSVAYLGQPGPDKGLIYLLQAWKQLNYHDATLTIAGYGTEHLLGLVRSAGGGNIYLRGRVDDIADVYNNCRLYVQPSASEGFGIEVLEAMAHGRPVVCSKGAGAVDVVRDSDAVHAQCAVVPARDAGALANAIATYTAREVDAKVLRAHAGQFLWEYIEPQYRRVYSDVL